VLNPKLTRLLRAVAQPALWFGAVNFGALVIVVAALTASGTVTRKRWVGAVRVLWGSSEALSTQDLARLREIAGREERWRGERSNAHLEKSWLELQAEKEKLDARAAELRARLMRIREAVQEERGSLAGREEAFERRVAEDEKKWQDRRADLERVASEKIRRIYRHMRPAAVAADLEARMRKEQGEEVAAILRRLPERTVAEVLESMRDPATRNEIYDLMRTPVALKSETEGETR
jgi:flagellar motility protein MotE (MotC chaperone)